MENTHRIAKIALDEVSIPYRRAEVEHELTVAIQDLQAENQFAPIDAGLGPYTLMLSVEDQRIAFEITDSAQGKTKFSLSYQPLKKIIRDYFLVCESYYDSITRHAPGRIEAIDMGRRGLHNEGADVLKELLEGKVELDFCTARRLFTLICVLSMK